MIIILSCPYSPDVGSPGMPASDDEDPRVGHHSDCGNEKSVNFGDEDTIQWFSSGVFLELSGQKSSIFLSIYFFLNTFFLELCNLLNMIFLYLWN